MGIDHCGGNGGVAEDFFDVRNGNIALDKPSCAGVAHGVKVDPFGKAAVANVALELMRN